MGNQRFLNDQELSAFVREQTGSAVFSGVFKGMVLGPKFSWSSLDIVSKLLGTYEQELHPFLLGSRQKSYDCVIDVGCAEGYYAVGLARLYKTARVFAYDISKASLEVCHENAILNRVEGRIELREHCNPMDLESLCARFNRPLIFCDAEGYETELFRDDKLCKKLANADVIIECHDFIVSGTTDVLKKKLSRTHSVSVVYAGERNPNAFPFLRDLYDITRWHAVCEHRPCTMNWIICESTKHRAPSSRPVWQLWTRKG